MSNGKRRFGWKYIVIFLIVIVLVLFGLFFVNRPKETGNELPAGVADDKQTAEEALTINETIDAVKAIKKDLAAVLNDIKKNRLDSARNRAETILQNVRAIRVSVDQTVGRLPLFQKQLEPVQELMNSAELGIENILIPGIDLLQTNPISDLRVGDGMNTKLVCAYLDFLESVLPDMERILQSVNAIDLSLIDTDGKIAEYLRLANEAMEICHEDPEVIAKAKAMLGAEEDRLYLLVAQNSAEIRASGGFPGSIGTIRIQDGVLTLGGFNPVNTVLAYGTPTGIKITDEEKELFGQLSGIQTPRDADLCPDFSRVGHIWAAAYEMMRREPVMGVVSVTPHIVQRLLAVVDSEIELADGTVLNGDNAMQVLQHDIYFKYFNTHYSKKNDDLTDQLFAEAAQKSMKKLMGNLTLSYIVPYLKIAKDSFEDRTIMLWMKDEGEQTLIRRMGLSGGLNTDPEKPETGVFFNCIIPSKMGWFLLMDTEIGARTKNKDGSYSYPVTVTFSNNITEEEINAASHYIAGAGGSSIGGAVYFFAPAGGTVSNFTVSDDVEITLKTYNGLQLGYLPKFYISPDVPITVTYTVTTAPNVETPLVVVQTPTAQKELHISEDN